MRFAFASGYCHACRAKSVQRMGDEKVFVEVQQVILNEHVAAYEQTF